MRSRPASLLRSPASRASRRIVVFGVLCGLIASFALWPTPVAAQGRVGEALEGEPEVLEPDPEPEPVKAAPKPAEKKPAEEVAPSKPKATAPANTVPVAPAATAPKPTPSAEKAAAKPSTPKSAPDGGSAPVPAAAANAPAPGAAAPATPAAPPAPAPLAVGHHTDYERLVDSEQGLLHAWSKRLDFLSERDARRAEEVERELQRSKDSLGLLNLVSMATALVREADGLAAAGRHADALARCETALLLAPGFPPAAWCRSRHSFGADPLAVGTVVGSALTAIQLSLSDPRWRRFTLADEGLSFVFAFAGAALLFLVLLIARLALLGLHDFHHLFPKGLGRWQSLLVAGTLVAVPALLGFGALGSLIVAMALVSLQLSRNEAIAAGVACLVLSLSLAAAGPVARAGAFGSVANDVYLLERGDAPTSSAERLANRLSAGAGDYTIAFAVGRWHKRFGRYPDAIAAFEVAKGFRSTGEVLTNIGNAHYLRGAPDSAEEAEKAYRKAIEANQRLVAARLNLAKICFEQGRLNEGEEIKRGALAIGGDAVRDGSAQVTEDKRANRKMIDEPLAEELIVALAEQEATGFVGLGGPVWSILAGRAPNWLGSILPLIAGALIAAAQFLRRRVSPSARCDKCGRPVCTRCDPELAAGSAMCGQCISVFVRRTGVDAPDRIRKEIEVRRFRRNQRLLVRALGLAVGGGGHVLAGRVVGGGLFLLVTGIVASRVFFWDGFLPLPVALYPVTPPLKVGLVVVALAVAYVASFLHLLRHEEAD